MDKMKVYLASGWFTPRTRDILDQLERMLDAHENVDLYSPRRDGIVLPPDQKHDTSLRESIFKENISNILKADLVVANIDSQDPYNDPGTIYEIGYAMANNIPVVGFCQGRDDNIFKRFKGIIPGFECLLSSYSDLHAYISTPQSLQSVGDLITKDKVLFVGNGDTEVDKTIAAHIMDSGANLRWVYDDHEEVYSRIDEIFAGVEYMVAVIDDRKTIVSWMIGQAYARNIPVVTYSNHNWGINVMLLVSVLTHIRGMEELDQFLQLVKRSGIESVPEFDISQMDSM